MKSVQGVVLVGKNQARAWEEVSTESGVLLDTQKFRKERRKGKSTRKLGKENLSSQFTQPGSHPNPLPSFLVQGLGRVSGSNNMDDDHKQTRSWIWIVRLFSWRHGDSIEKTQWPFLSHRLCVAWLGWCQSVLIWLQEKNNLRFPFRFDGKSVNMSPSMGQPVLKWHSALPLQDTEMRPF